MKRLLSFSIKSATFWAVIAAGVVAQMLSALMKIEFPAELAVMRVSMWVSFPAVAAVRLAANTPWFPRMFLIPTFWLVELGWAMIAACLIRVGIKPSRRFA